MHPWLKDSVAAPRRWSARLRGLQRYRQAWPSLLRRLHRLGRRCSRAAALLGQRSNLRRNIRGACSSLRRNIDGKCSGLRTNIGRLRAQLVHAVGRLHAAGRARVVAWLRRGRLRLPGLRKAIWVKGIYRRRHGLGARFSGPSPALGYRLYIPPAARANAALPLLVMLHGCHQSASSFAAGTRMNRLAEHRGFAVLYPEQSTSFNRLRCWSWFRPRDEHAGEGALITGMIEEICAHYALDRQRVYIAGMSAGAAMARVLTARHGTLFAACGLHSGVMYKAAASAAQVAATMNYGSAASPEATGQALAAGPAGDVALVPTIAIHGAADTVVSPVNFDQLAAQLNALDAHLNGARGSGPQRTESSERVGGRICTICEYARKGRVYLRSYLIEGLGHAWSGGDPAYQFNDGGGPCASELIWEFVSRYRRDRETPGPAA